MTRSTLENTLKLALYFIETEQKTPAKETIQALLNDVRNTEAEAEAEAESDNRPVYDWDC